MHCKFCMLGQSKAYKIQLKRLGMYKIYVWTNLMHYNVCTVDVTEKFMLHGRATFTSTDRSTVARTGVADIAYV